MEDLVIQAREVRLPKAAREALEQGDSVVITRYGRPAMAAVAPEAFQAVRPIIERRRKGLPVCHTDLLNSDDIAVIVEDQQQ